MNSIGRKTQPFCSRRQFMGAAVVAAPGLLLSGSCMTADSAGKKSRAYKGIYQGCMKTGSQREAYSRELMQYHKRHGVNHIAAYPGVGSDGRWRIEQIQRYMETANQEGVEIEMLHLPVTSTFRAVKIKSGDAETPDSPDVVFPNIFSENPDRDRELDEVCRMIAIAGELGIRTLGYNFRPIPTQRTSRDHPLRGGANATAWDITKAPAKGPGISFFGPLPQDLFWERVSYILDKIVPVAEQYRVRLAHHPFDPPFPESSIFHDYCPFLGSVEGNKRFLEMKDSPYHGIVFCVGTFSEGMVNPAAEVVQAIRFFGERERIFHVHLRNITGGLNNFVETYPDDGDIDLYSVIKVLRDAGYDGMVVPDHMPRHPDDVQGRFPMQAFAYGFGYINALIQAAYAEGPA